MSLVLKRPRNVAHHDKEIGRTPSEFEGVHVKFFIFLFLFFFFQISSLSFFLVGRLLEGYQRAPFL